MIRLLQLLIYGHIHEWETLETRDLSVHHGIGSSTGIRYYLRCKKCCQVIKRDLA